MKKSFVSFLNLLKAKKYFSLLKYFLAFIWSDKAISFPKMLSAEDLIWIKRILILAPHPDDEVFWMWGAILFFKKIWIQIDFMWFSNSDSVERVNESKKFISALWYRFDQEFSFPLSWDFITKNTTVQVLEKVFKHHSYDIVCLPSFLDTHNDHQALFWAVKEFFTNQPRQNIRFLQYEVWNTTIPNILIDISEFIDEKKKLMQIYVSQLDIERDYLSRMVSLNHYRGLTYSRQYCEAFIFSDYESFIKQ